MKMLKKGFTLIELLAVIVILAVLMLVAGSNVFGVLDDAKRGSFHTEFLSLLQSAQTKAQVDLMNNVINGSNRVVCYAIDDTTSATHNLAGTFSNSNNYKGSVKVEYTTDGKLNVTGWMSSDQFIIQNKDNTSKSSDVQNANGSVASATCGS